MSSPRKHHYLPQFYLKGFSNNRISIYQMVKSDCRNFKCNIKDAAAIRDFHVIDEEVDDPQLIERRIAEVESDLSRHYSSFLMNGIKSADEDVYACLLLLSFLRVRVPAFKSHIENSLLDIVRQNLEPVIIEGGLIIEPADIEIEIKNWAIVQEMMSLAAEFADFNVLNNMRLSIINAPLGKIFVTSDQPVSIFHEEAWESSLGFGPSSQNVEIILPLSSGKVLKLDHVSGRNQEYTATPDEVMEINRRTIVMANEYVFAAEVTEELKNLVACCSEVKCGFLLERIANKSGNYQLHSFKAVGPRKDVK